MTETFSKISSIIAGDSSESYSGGYFHDIDGTVVMTDKRRLLVIRDEEKIKRPVYFKNGEKLKSKDFPKYKKYIDCTYEITKEWAIDLGAFIMEHKWMDVPVNKLQRVLFRTKAIQKKGKRAHETIDCLNIFNIRFIADFLRCVRTYYKNRTKSLNVTIKFTSDEKLKVSPCYIETEDKKFLYILMPISFTPNQLFVDRTNIENLEKIDI